MFYFDNRKLQIDKRLWSCVGLSLHWAHLHEVKLKNGLSSGDVWQARYDQLFVVNDVCGQSNGYFCLCQLKHYQVWFSFQMVLKALNVVLEC